MVVDVRQNPLDRQGLEAGALRRPQPPDDQLAQSPILKAGQNVWRIERAERAAILVDGGQYFGALRETLANARRTIFILGWDVDSRTRLVGESGKIDDGLPEEFIPFLNGLVERNAHLLVHILVWDYSVLYALEREFFPAMSLRWRTPRRIRFCLDDQLPLGASHHQKIVVVDDAVAFSGGMDVTTRRWDTREHRFEHPHRVDLNGLPYPPFHDIQAVVDGPAARALGELARARWANGACERPPPLRPIGDPWPASITPDLTAIDVGIARTYPAVDDEPQIREAEALFLQSIDHAEQAIYIENQYLTARPFAERLAKRMQQRPELEVVIVAPKAPHSWLEEQTMHAGRVRFIRALEDAELQDRFQLMYPKVTEGGKSVDTMIHSKVMIVDDRLLRVGSSNLNNRSFLLDTECDLAFEARTAAHRESIVNVRNNLLAHHCGVSSSEIAETLQRTGSLVQTARSSRSARQSLETIEETGAAAEVSALERFADPEQPISTPVFLESFVGNRPPAHRISRFARLIVVGMAVVAMLLLWHFTPLSTLLDAETVREGLTRVDAMPFAPVLVIAIYIVAGLLVFPITLVIAATGAAFGPWLGFAYALIGSVLSAMATFGLGALIGRQALQGVFGPRLNRIRQRIIDRGLIAVVAVRMVPIAPFTVVNLVAGASRVRFVDFVLGTLIGIAPGAFLMSALGRQILLILTEPTLPSLALLAAIVLGWIVLSLLVQFALLRLRGRQRT